MRFFMAIPDAVRHVRYPTRLDTFLNLATGTNYTSYSRGINGVMVDIVGLPAVPTDADFEFKVGNDSDPDGAGGATWNGRSRPVSTCAGAVVSIG